MTKDIFETRKIIIDRAIKTGTEITTELDILISMLSDNLEDTEIFLNDINHTSMGISKPFQKYAKEVAEKSVNELRRFEKELAGVSDYDESENLFTVDNSVLNLLDKFDEINSFMRFKIEEYIMDLENLRNSIDVIVMALSYQQAGVSGKQNLVM